MSDDSYFLKNLDQYKSPTGGHYTNLEILQSLNNDLSNFPWERFATEDGNTGVVCHLLDNIGAEFKFALDIGAYSKLASNVVPISARYGARALLLDGENKHNDPDVAKVWITKENICELLSNFGAPKKMDFISLDIDNMDYWILKSLFDGGYTSNVLIAEFNPAFSYDEAYTKDYFSDATKNGPYTAGSSNYGASLGALTKLANSFDYNLIHVMPNNAIFLKRKFDVQEMFANQSEVLKKLHPEPYIEPHKKVANERKYDTSDLSEVRKLLKETFVSV